MFFPAEPDALSPLTKFVVPYKPPRGPIRNMRLSDMNGPPLSAFPANGWCAPEETLYDEVLVRTGFAVPAGHWV